MNKKQIEVQKSFLNDEEAVLASLEKTYKQSLNEINAKSKELQKQIEKLQMGMLNGAMSEEEKEQMQSMIRSKVYQKKYQDSLKKQVSGILDDMHKNSYKTIASYLDGCYKEGFLGAMYDMQGQGVPLFFPMDQEAMVKAVQLDSKIKKSLYSSIGEDVANLKKTITATVSRGIATGSTYTQIAQQIKGKMVGVYDNVGGALYRAETIARTEGHRIQVQSAMDACHKAKGKGADVLKQWDSTMDSATRESHVSVDGEIRELDKPFSNGLMFPGDPNGGAGEVVNCRCALLQRARWALDDDELEALKEKASFFGVDKSDSFEDFKEKYLGVVKQPEVKPKKEYLTKKKLEQKIADANAELKQLHADFEEETFGWTYDEVIKDFGDLETFADEDDLLKLKPIELKMKEVSKNKEEWEEMLHKKVVSSESKKLKKQQILLQDELDAFDVKTYSGIWKDDVTTEDWLAKKDAIPKKKQYFENKLLYANDVDEANKWKALIDACDDFDKNGKAYNDIQQKLNKTKADLKKLQKNGKVTPKDLDAFTQERKDAALWAKTTKKADDKLRDVCGDVWQKANQQERYAIYDYTCGSGKFNRPLSGFEKPYMEYGTGWEQKWFKGIGNVWIDFEDAGDEIRHMTNIISKSSYDFDVWLQHGCNGSTLESFLGLQPNTFTRMSESELQQFVGRSNRRGSFLSCGVSKGKGFDHQPVIINVYAPKGTQMMYAEPFSHFGNGGKLNWNGISQQSSFGYEAEMIVQRGASYTITKVEKSGGKIYMDMEIHPEDGYDLFQQDPSEWKGSTKKGR